MLLPLLFVAIGFTVLYFGADWLVRGASTIASNLNVSKVIVGLTLVAFGTSSPELFVNLIASYRGHTGLALANIAGSNLTNLCIGFGICAFLGRVVLNRKKYRIDLAYFSLTPILIVFFFIIFPRQRLPFWAIVPFAIAFILYLISLKRRLYSEEVEENKQKKLIYGISYFLGGLVTLYLGGELVFRSALKISNYLGISETVIGITLVAFGTSIPDVMASVVAIRKGENSIAVGNLIGSNIFNILLVLGGTLLISGQDLFANQVIIKDYIMVSISSIFFIIIVSLSQRVSRLSGLILIAIYIIYMAIRVQSS